MKPRLWPDGTREMGIGDPTDSELATARAWIKEQIDRSRKWLVVMDVGDGAYSIMLNASGFEIARMITALHDQIAELEKQEEAKEKQ